MSLSPYIQLPSYTQPKRYSQFVKPPHPPNPTRSLIISHLALSRISISGIISPQSLKNSRNIVTTLSLTLSNRGLRNISILGIIRTQSIKDGSDIVTLVLALGDASASRGRVVGVVGSKSCENAVDVVLGSRGPDFDLHDGGSGLGVLGIIGGEGFEDGGEAVLGLTLL